MPNKASMIFQLLRVKHWTKNLFVFVPAFFAARILEEEVLFRSLIAFIGFSLTASAIYIINDIGDRKADSLHPTKSKRPIASGNISLTTAIITAIVLMAVAFGLAFPISQKLLYILLAYAGMNILYTYYLKQFAIIDISIIALGFLFRIYSGGLANDIPISSWLVIMIFLLSLFMGFAKRRDDVILLEERNIVSRKNIGAYNKQFIEICMSILAAVIIVSYVMYTLSPEVLERTQSSHLYITSLFVILGVLRYLHRTMVENKEGNPVTVFLHDRQLQIILLCWILSLSLILYQF